LKKPSANKKLVVDSYNMRRHCRPLKRALTRKVTRGHRMTTIDRPLTGGGNLTNILDRERIIATAGFNRWLVPPAALCIHLCIGMA
jgi:hypothetical protein